MSLLFNQTHTHTHKYVCMYVCVIYTVYVCLCSGHKVSSSILQVESIISFENTANPHRQKKVIIKY